MHSEMSSQDCPAVTFGLAAWGQSGGWGSHPPRVAYYTGSFPSRPLGYLILTIVLGDSLVRKCVSKLNHIRVDSFEHFFGRRNSQGQILLRELTLPAR